MTTTALTTAYAAISLRTSIKNTDYLATLFRLFHRKHEDLLPKIAGLKTSEIDNPDTGTSIRYNHKNNCKTTEWLGNMFSIYQRVCAKTKIYSCHTSQPSYREKKYNSKRKSTL